MKRVIVSKNVCPVVNVQFVSYRKYYGVLITVSPYDPRKGFITRQNYNSDKYFVMCRDSVTMGNRFGWDNDDLKKLITTIINGKDSIVFEFDTSQQLFEWLSQ